MTSPSTQAAQPNGPHSAAPRSHYQSSRAPKRPSSPGRSRTVLLVEAPRAPAFIENCPRITSIITTRYRDINGAILELIKPACVMFPLFSARFNSFDLISQLEEMGYRGHAIALSPPLPDRNLVQAELRSQANYLRVRVLHLPD